MISNLSSKRELLADLLAGNVASLQAYQRQQRQRHSLYARIIDERSVGGLITVYLREGGQREMRVSEFEQLPSTTGVWTIEDMTGGRPVPGIDK